MSFETIISRFGYPALAVGLLLEGETVLVLAAFMARRGYLELPWVILIGFAVTFASDQFFFWLGRLHGDQFLESRPAWKQNVERAKSLLGRNMTLLFIVFRFMYGLRTVLPLAFGISQLNPRRFALLNFIGALLWAVIFGMAGYLFGQLMEIILADVGKYELWIALGIVAIGVGVWLFRHHIPRTKKGARYE
ncbi:MAG TPA: DedA family protein [Anaerolineales bacterium]|nr:DedA family protein [Anaerolineales bacterium]